MRVLLVLAMIPLLAACSVFTSSEPSATLVDVPPGTETAAGAPDSTEVPATEITPTAANGTAASAAPATAPAATAPAASAPVAAKTPAPAHAPITSTVPDISGKWIGSWIGTGLFNSPRQENLTLDLAQKGEAGYGRMVLDGSTAAESVPWDVRQQGLGGIRVFAAIDGSKVRLTHELDDRLFTADLTVSGDQMVGYVKGRKVRLLLARQNGSPAPAREVPPQAAQVMPPTIVANAPQPAPAAMPAQQAQAPVETPKAEEPVQRPRNEEYVRAPELKSLHFDFDKSVLRPDAVDALSSNVTWLKENADTFVLIEGNADERGTAEYNLALGNRRAQAARAYLISLGIPADRLRTVSYGKEFPFDPTHNESGWSKNRRAHFVLTSK
jgi:peptidoglycan-associated lipoprotein